MRRAGAVVALHVVRDAQIGEDLRSPIWESGAQMQDDDNFGEGKGNFWKENYSFFTLKHVFGLVLAFSWRCSKQLLLLPLES